MRGATAVFLGEAQSPTARSRSGGLKAARFLVASGRVKANLLGLCRD